MFPYTGSKIREVIRANNIAYINSGHSIIKQGPDFQDE